MKSYNDAMLDPISLEPITQPVVDHHGHIFDQKSYELYVANQVAHGRVSPDKKFVRCPLSREPIRVQLPPLVGGEVIFSRCYSLENRVQTLEKSLFSNPEISSKVESMFEDYKAIIKASNIELRACRKELKMVRKELANSQANNNRLEKLNIDLKNQLDETENKKRGYRAKASHLEKKDNLNKKEREKFIKNIQEMSICDRFMLLFNEDHIKEVISRK